MMERTKHPHVVQLRLLEHPPNGVSHGVSQEGASMLRQRQRQKPEDALPERMPLPRLPAIRLPRLVAGEPGTGCP